LWQRAPAIVDGQIEPSARVHRQHADEGEPRVMRPFQKRASVVESAFGDLVQQRECRHATPAER